MLGAESGAQLGAAADHQRGEVRAPQRRDARAQVPLLALLPDAALDEVRQQHELLRRDLHEIHPGGDGEDEVSLAGGARGPRRAIAPREGYFEREERENRLHHGPRSDLGRNRHGNFRSSDLTEAFYESGSHVFQISMAVCSMLYQLAIRQNEQEKIYQELCRVIPDPNTPLTHQTLEQCHYLKAFIKEVLRVYSTVIGNGRTLQEDTVICGYNIPKGIQVVFPTIVTGTMEEYCKNSDVFRPERWLKPSQGGTGETVHPFASLPYGYGARMCLGRRFADLEMQMLLAKVRLELLFRMFLDLISKSLLSAASVKQVGIQLRTVGLRSHVHVRARRKAQVQDDET